MKFAHKKMQIVLVVIGQIRKKKNYTRDWLSEWENIKYIYILSTTKIPSVFVSLTL